jgi:hypothetical protein
MLLINVYYRGQILNTSTGAGYDIRAACTFSIDETISIHDLKRQIHVSLKMLPSHFNIIISARINTAQQVRARKMRLTLVGSCNVCIKILSVLVKLLLPQINIWV